MNGSVGVAVECTNNGLHHCVTVRERQVAARHLTQRKTEGGRISGDRLTRIKGSSANRSWRMHASWDPTNRPHVVAITYTFRSRAMAFASTRRTAVTTLTALVLAFGFVSPASAG